MNTSTNDDSTARLDPLRETSAWPTERPAARKAQHPLRVLLAEDSPANQLVVERMLHSRGHEVCIAENGAEAVEAAAREPFDVVLMDIQMPGMDGIEATRLIRRNSRGAEIPIVGFSAYTGPFVRSNCKSVGMNAFLAKPADWRTLISTVERFGAA